MINSAMGGGINVWCMQHIQEMGKVEREAMDGEDRRTKTVEELGTLKGDLQEAKASGDWGKAVKVMDEFMAKHAGDPDFKDINAALGDDKAKLDGTLGVWEAANGQKGLGADATKGASAGAALAMLDGLVTKVASLSDGLTKANQMGMLYIQEANSQENQVLQTASNLESSRSSARQTSVNNIRG